MAEAHYFLGVLFASKNMYKEAIAENKKVIGSNPDYVNAHFNLGTLYHKQEQFEEAIAEYSKTISLDPGFADAYFNKGQALISLGKKSEAHDEYEKYRMVKNTARGSTSLLEFDSKLLGTLEQFEYNMEQIKEEIAKQEQERTALPEIVQ
jgi:tetratricopeptide (TPR) repeat protein